MREVTFLERLAENLLEGGFARVLKTRLQPVQVAKTLAREMERSQVVAPDALLVANRYVVHLHPDDFAAFAGFQGSLERELSTYLGQLALRRGFKPLSPPLVRLVAASPPGRLGRARVEAFLVDPEPPLAAAHPARPESWEGTAELAVVSPAGPPAPERPPAHLVDVAGQTLELAGVVTSIGRALDNDIVLEAGGVSRHHARIAWGSGGYLLQDLGSTNGTFVSAQRITEHPLSDGEEISLGGTCFTFRQGAGPTG